MLHHKGKSLQLLLFCLFVFKINFISSTEDDPLPQEVHA